ncbi:MAG TPA: hypothetical protein VFP54_08750 [Acidimicrobiales bacterium]|nr:hypothetical protein [Acidimicrobiales bacterium]
MPDIPEEKGPLPDLLEQNQPVTDEAVVEEPTHDPEAPEADALEQAIEVLDDDDRRD